MKWESLRNLNSFPPVFVDDYEKNHCTNKALIEYIFAHTNETNGFKKPYKIRFSGLGKKPDWEDKTNKLCETAEKN